MNKRKHSYMNFCICIILLFLLCSNHAQAYDNDSIIIECDNQEELRADVITTYYKAINNRMYYRRWNETRGYWVDPDWIPL